MLLSILNCTEQTNVNTKVTTQVNIYANYIECWQGAYYIHAIFSIVISIAFVIVCFIVQMTYYENKYFTENVSAKTNSKSDVFVLISKIIILIVFSFFGNTDNQWILVAIIFFLSAYTFFCFYDDRPYYNSKVMKVK